MRKNAFTLIELLAVIVILAIIALIAVPIVINIINDAKVSSEEENLKLYEDAVQKMIVKKQMQDPLFNPSTCEIKEDGNLECIVGMNKVDVKVEVKGQTPESGIVKIDGNKVTFKNVVLNNKTYYEVYATLVNDASLQGLSVGDEYTYKVNDQDTFNFYVLSIEKNKVNLIMDRNICEDGTATYTEANNYCRYAWHEGEDNNNYGPNTAMSVLYNATKEWTNVPDMIMNYNDEYNDNSSVCGYEGIKTTNGITTIIGKNNASNTIIGSNAKPLKARLPMHTEIYNIGCTHNEFSCPDWIVDNLKYWKDSSYGDYIINKQNEYSTVMNKVVGYWYLPSEPTISKTAKLIIYRGEFATAEVSITSLYGIRPVITVPKEYLEN